MIEMAADRTTPPPASVALPEECGATVADARRLARKAESIFIHYPCGPDDWQTGVIMLTRGAFLRSIKYANQAQRMPCKLYQQRPDSLELWLQIGG
jgi:hypothetical protein